MMPRCSRCKARCPVRIPRHSAERGTEWLCEYCDDDDHQRADRQQKRFDVPDNPPRTKDD
jgi:hypothetical protein